MNRRLERSAVPTGTASEAAKTVGTLLSATARNRSIKGQRFRMAAGLRQPAAERTTRQPPADSVAKACVSAPPTWKSGMPNSRLTPGSPLSCKYLHRLRNFVGMRVPNEFWRAGCAARVKVGGHVA